MAVGTQCPSAQTFMVVSMMYEFFMRVYLLNNTEISTAVCLKQFRVFLKKNSNLQLTKVMLVTTLTSSAIMLIYSPVQQTQQEMHSNLQSCNFGDAGDGLYLYEHNLFE